MSREKQLFFESSADIIRRKANARCFMKFHPGKKNGSPYCNLAYLIFSDLQLSFVEVGVRFSFSGEIAAERKEYEIKKRKKMLCA